jgi:SOS-response transcriptional repressor LexA
MSYGMTKRQSDALRFICGFVEAKGYGPSIAEIGAGLGRCGKAVPHDALRGLERRGHIRRLPHRARAIEVVSRIAVPRSPDGEPLYYVEVA